MSRYMVVFNIKYNFVQVSVSRQVRWDWTFCVHVYKHMESKDNTN